MSRRTVRFFVVVVFVMVGLMAAGAALANRDLPPGKGGTTYSLGMPPVYKGRSGFELQWYRPENNSELAGRFYKRSLQERFDLKTLFYFIKSSLS